MEEVLGGGKEFSPREPQLRGVSACGQLWQSPNPSADTDAWKGVSPTLELERERQRHQDEYSWRGLPE